MGLEIAIVPTRRDPPVVLLLLRGRGTFARRSDGEWEEVHWGEDRHGVEGGTSEFVRVQLTSVPEEEDDDAHPMEPRDGRRRAEPKGKEGRHPHRPRFMTIDAHEHGGQTDQHRSEADDDGEHPPTTARVPTRVRDEVGEALPEHLLDVALDVP